MAEAPPPDLPGYDFLRELGHGGFADVHLYRQRMPAREVAVKVVRQPASSEADREQFANEANRMAMLSSHPSIVTIYEVGVSPDDRPYLTMEYCPHDHFGRIARSQPLTVPRALEVGIKVAAAVETAHASSILHRDVKPANILLTTYGEPALTDFGIAGGGIDSDRTDELAVSQGVSIPFAAPEVLRGSTVGDERSDVYSLGATVYALLAGRAPFSTGRDLTEVDLIDRILRAPLPPTGRPDVPPSLERVLANAMAREPANRYSSAAAFGRALQGIEAELGLAQTFLRIAGTSITAPGRSAEPDDDSTRFTAVQRVDPGGAPPAPQPASTASPSTSTDARSPEPLPGWDRAPGRSLPDGALGDRTIPRRSGSSAPAPGADPDPTPSTGSTRRVVLAGAGVIVVLAIAFVLSKRGGEEDIRTTTTTTPATDPLVTGGTPPRPERVRIERTPGGGQVITWSIPSPQDGDSYQVFYTEGPGDLIGQTTSASQAELRIDVDRRVCVTVETIRAGRVSAASTEVCSP